MVYPSHEVRGTHSWGTRKSLQVPPQIRLPFFPCLHLRHLVYLHLLLYDRLKKRGSLHHLVQVLSALKGLNRNYTMCGSHTEVVSCIQSEVDDEVDGLVSLVVDRTVEVAELQVSLFGALPSYS
jgi:hypothetical protein